MVCKTTTFGFNHSTKFSIRKKSHYSLVAGPKSSGSMRPKCLGREFLNGEFANVMNLEIGIGNGMQIMKKIRCGKIA